jgi:ER membrane protein complex subunit 7
MILNKLIYLVWFITSVSGALLKGKLDPSVLHLSPAELTSTWLELRSLENFQLTKAHLRQGGSFAFTNVPQGIYELSIHSIIIGSYQNVKWRVDVADDESVQVYQVFPGHSIFKDTGPKEVTSPLILKPLHRRQYFIPREGFSLLGMVKSPMMLLSIASLGLVFILPKMTANLDPEALKELQEKQSQQSEALSSMSNFDMASFLAGKSKANTKKD